MINLLLVSPKTEKSQGGMTVWTDTFLSHCHEFDISCDLVNIATIGSRAVQGNSKRNFLDEFVRTKAIFKNLKQKLNNQNYQASHVNTSCGAFGLVRDYMIVRYIKNRQSNCKCIVHFHCDVNKQTQVKYKRYFLKKILKITDGALVLNDDNKKYLNQISSINVVAVPNFINEDLVINKEKNISESIKKAVFVGFVQPRKGIQEIYELAKMFENITFDLIGEVREDVKGWVKPHNVILHGAKTHNEILMALDEADVFIFPTYSEGFSIALLESMSRGLPCITTPVGANEEMLEGQGGSIVAVGDVVAMAEALESMQNQDMRKNMSIWNVQKVRSNYTVKAVMKKFTELYTSKY